MPRYRSFDEHLDASVGPKRILSLDGGGLRGMMTVQVLRKIETLLRDRFDQKLRLCDYFDLIAGTSTGAIIAGGLSLGMTVDEIEKKYKELGDKVFMRSFWRRGIARDSYDSEAVAAALRGVYGTGLLKRDDFKTGLLVVAKRGAGQGPPSLCLLEGGLRRDRVTGWQSVSHAGRHHKRPASLSKHPDRNPAFGHFLDTGKKKGSGASAKPLI